jgi:hypothetical protein
MLSGVLGTMTVSKRVRIADVVIVVPFLTRVVAR